MSASVTNQVALLGILRWSARILSIPAVCVVLLFAFGEGLHLSRFTARELLLFAFFPFGVCLGMALAWRWEGLGGGITVASLAAFYLAHRLSSPGFPRGFAFVAIAAPGFLFLLCWLWTRSRAKSAIQRGGVTLAVLLLAAGAPRPATAADASKPPVSKETRECLNCHSEYNQGLAEDWM